MSSVVYGEPGYDFQEICDRVCSCGHKLSYHGFTYQAREDGSIVVYVSQCCFCDYNKETGKFNCEGFH